MIQRALIVLIQGILLTTSLVWAQETPRHLRFPMSQIIAFASRVQFRNMHHEPYTSVKIVEGPMDLLFDLDGDMSDWKKQKPLWNEAGVKGGGPFEHSIDIRQVFLKNDDMFLFVFMQVSPTVEERFKISDTGDIVGYLYLDSDNNPETGSSEVVKYEGFTEDKYRGYDVKIFLPVGVMSSSKGQTPYVGYEIRSLDNGEFSVISGFKQNSYSSRALIAHGKDGIEFALPLDKLAFMPPKTIRILLCEQAHFSKKEGYTFGQFDLE